MPVESAERVTVASPGVVVRRPWIAKVLRWLAFTAATTPLAIMMIGGGIFDMARPDAWPEIIVTMFGGGALMGVASFVLAWPFRKKAAKVSADGTNIEVTGEDGHVRAIPNSEIRQAAIIADPLNPGVSLDLSGGRSMSVRTRSAEEAQRLLAAIEPAGKAARYRMELRPSLLAAGGGCVSWLAAFAMTGGLFGLIKSGLPGVVGGSAWTFAVAGILALFFLFTSRPTVEVGADGVVVRELLRSRFVPFRDLESVRAENKGVEMRYPDGRVERVRLREVSLEQLAALDDRLSRAFAASRGDTAGGRAAALVREGRSVADWRAHLAGLLAKGEGYRAAALTREEAEAVLAAGDATPEHRLGAALALVAADRDRAKDRLRIAAEGCANPKLRVALADLSEGDLEDAALLEAIGTDDAKPSAEDRT